jgi:ABC-type dipeptide/oligopeptide/nickel transport system permease component
MLAYVIRRVLANFVILLGIIFLVFAVARISPIDPVRYVLLSEGQSVDDIDPVRYEEMREELGLNDPIPVQFAAYLSDLARGDLGNSIINPGRSVNDVLRQGLPVSLHLALMGFAGQAFLGTLIGVLAANRQNSLFDRSVMSISIIAGSIPVLVWGVLLIVPFGVALQWFPFHGWGGPEYWILPVLALIVSGLAGYARFARAAVLDQLRQDFTRTAYAKGLPERRVLFGHVLRNAMVPIVTFIAPSIAFIVYGNFIVETMFGIPGIAYYAITSTVQGDYPMIQGTVLLFAFFIMTVNLITDILYGIMDPRIRITQ